MDHVQQLARAAPSNFNEAKPDWLGVAEVLRTVSVEPNDIAAATWCQLGHANIEALVDAPTLVLVHPRGVLATLGKKKMLGSGMKFDAIDFAQVRTCRANEYQDERGFGKFCIEFTAAGGMLLGRLQWRWQGKRFQNNADQIIAVAEERDRILGVVGNYFNGART